jgi:diguanylate cyclase (GGDEF)-like protein
MNPLKSHLLNNTTVIFRWLLLFPIIATFAAWLQKGGNLALNLIIFGMIILYNILLSVFLLKIKHPERNTSYVFMYVDIIFLSLFIFSFGGLASDFYIIYYFIIAFCAFLNSAPNTFRISVASLVAYTIACLAAEKEISGEFLLTLAQRDFLLILGAFAISRLNIEVKKHDDLHKNEYRLARTDKLTGLNNRHFFDQKIQEEIEYSQTSGKPLNILMFDLDDFKIFNDTYGHNWGDRLLIMFSEIIKQNIRKADIPVRYGGEEFLIMIRDLDLNTAKSVADRIRLQLEKQRLNAGIDENRHRLTVSCGIAQFPTDSTDIRKVIEFADKALYRSKSSGKNMITKYSDIAKSDD